MLPKQPNQSVIDGIRCLQGVVTSESPVGVSDLSRELGLEMTRTHRLLRTLTHIGLVRWTPGRKYAPGPGLPVLAAQTLRASNFHKAIPMVEKLHKEVDMVVALGVLWNRSVSYLYHAVPDMPLERAVGGFEVWPATLSGLGIVLLSKWDAAAVEELYEDRPVPGFPEGIADLKAVLEETSRQGYAFVDQSDYVQMYKGQGHHTLAVAVDYDLSLSLAISGEISKDAVPDFLSLLQEYASEISNRMKF